MYVKRWTLFAVLVAGAASADIITNSMLTVETPTEWSGVTNIYTNTVVAGHLNASLTLKNRSLVRLMGRNGVNNAPYPNFYIATNNNDVTLRLEGHSLFATTWRNSTSPTDWANTHIDPAGNSSTYLGYISIHVGSDTEYGTTGRAAIEIMDNSAGYFGGNNFGAFWAEHIYVHPSVTAGTDGYVDLFTLGQDVSADIGAIRVTHPGAPVRMIFNGGRFYLNNATRRGWHLFYPKTDSTIVLQGVNSNEIKLFKQYGMSQLSGREGGNVVFRGKDIRFQNNGDRVGFVYNKSTGATEWNFHPWQISANDHVTWEHTGNIIIDCHCVLKTENDDLLPHGPAHGKIVLRYYEEGGSSVDRNYPYNTINKAWWSAIDLAGTSQRLNSVTSENESTYGFMGFISNSIPTVAATARFGTHDDDSTLNAICWPGVTVQKEGTGTLTVRQSEAVDMNVLAGTVVFARSGSQRANIVTNLTVAAGAVLRGKVTVNGTFTCAAGADCSQLMLTLAPGAKVAGTATVYKIYRNGDNVADGTYVAGDWLAADSEVTVLMRDNISSTATYVWQGGTADNALAEPANWVSPPDPTDFASGGVKLDFSSGTAAATVSGTPKIFGADFGSARAGKFELSGADANAVLTLENGGLAAAGAVTAEVAVAVALRSLPQTWTAADTAKIAVKGALVAPGLDEALTLTGSGTYDFHGDNSGFTAPVTIDKSIVNLNHANALGVGDNAVTVAFGGAGTAASKNYLYFDSSVSAFDRPLNMTGGTQYFSHADRFTFTRQVTTYGSGITGSMSVPPSKTLEFAGGFDCQKVSRWFFNGYEGSHLVFSGRPFTAGSTSVLNSSCGNRDSWIHFNVAGNSYPRILLISGSIACGVENALCETGWLVYGRDDWCGDNGKERMRLDLGGFDQRVAGIDTDWTTVETGRSNYSLVRCATVTSSLPATVTYTGRQTRSLGYSKNIHSAIRFRGEAGLTIAPTEDASVKSFYITVHESDTAGPLTVESGTLTMEQGARWSASTNVTVCGTGTLAVDAETAPAVFGVNGANTCLNFADSGKLDIPAGSVVTVRNLKVNGAYVKRGTYGAAGSGAADTTTYANHFVENGGYLRVRLSALPGCAIIIR